MRLKVLRCIIQTKKNGQDRFSSFDVYSLIQTNRQTVYIIESLGQLDVINKKYTVLDCRCQYLARGSCKSQDCRDARVLKLVPMSVRNVIKKTSRHSQI